jgi:hypothetical protein
VVQCANQESEFFTSVAVELTGNIPPSSDAIQALEKGFKETYNGRNEVRCDPFFRRVRSVLVVVDSIVVKGTQRYVVRYQIDGICRGCPPETNLFLRSTERRYAADGPMIDSCKHLSPVGMPPVLVSSVQSCQGTTHARSIYI